MIMYQIAQAQAATGMQSWMLPIMMVGFILFFYFVVIRPQNKKKKEMQLMINAIKKNDRIVTIGGLHGKVVNVKENTITIRVDDNAEITFEKSAISRVVSQKNKENGKESE